MDETTTAVVETTGSSDEALTYVIELITLAFKLFAESILDFLDLIGIDVGFDVVDE